jgi:hypothetical protein
MLCMNQILVPFILIVGLPEHFALSNYCVPGLHKVKYARTIMFARALILAKISTHKLFGAKEA